MKATRAFRRSQLLLCTALAGAAGTAQAQASGSLLDDSFVFNLGGFIVNTDTRARLDGSSTQNPDVDFDRTFGNAEDATRIRADMLWRITPAHHLRFMYFDNSIDRTKVLSETVSWGDYTFNVGANVRSETTFKIAELAYEYAFLRQPNYELAASIGVHYTDLSMRLSGTATVTEPGGGSSIVTSAVKEGNTPVPLPVVGFRAGWMFAPQWYLDAQVQFFKAEVDEFDGSLTDVRAGVTWMFARNFGVGLGYNRFTTKIDVAKPSFNGNIRLGYAGAQLYLTGSF